MELLSKERTLEVARGLVEASPADETEVTIESTVDRYARYAGDGPTQSADRERYHVAVRVRLAGDDGRREARAICDGLDPAMTRATIERAVELATVAPPNTELLPLGGPVEVEDRRADPETLAHPFEEKARWVQLALEGCEAAGMVPAGLCQTTGLARAIVNSAGRAVYGQTSQASLSLTASAPGFADGAGFAEQFAARVADIDAERVVRRAVDKAVRSEHPEAVEPGDYTVVLEPPAVSALLLFSTYKGFGAQEVHEKASFLCGRTGKKLFPEGLSLMDDSGNAVFSGFAFDGEGSPRQRVALIDHGVLGGPVTDESWARKLGVPNTGHALPLPNSHGPSAENPVLLPGDQSLEQLIAGVERGLLISQFHYTNLIDPTELTLTGMTRNGTFRIEDGKLGAPVKNLRFTQSLVEALERVTGIGSELEVAGALFDGTVVCPALRVDGFRFTSTADF